MGGELRATALDLGMDLMPWQRLVADVAGEVDPDGSPHYQIAVVTVMRQNGKTTLILPIEVHRSLVWARPQRIVYAAQSRSMAREKLIEDQIPMLEASLLGDWGRKRLAAGSEQWRWSNGSRIGLQSNTKKAGHGLTNDLVVLDEAFAQIDWRMEQSLMPTLATKQDWQWWTFSTAGDESSVYLLDKVRRGRHLVESGQDSRIAYFDWSIPVDADIDDPVVWRRHIPALGITIREEELSTFRANMPDDEFRRAFGNQWVDSADMVPQVVPPADWAAMADRDAKRDPAGRGRLAVDVAPDGSSTAIGMSVERPDGRRHVEVLEERPGMGWVAGRCAEILGRPGRDQFQRTVVLSLAASGALVPELEQAGLTVEPIRGPDWNSACASFLNACVERRLVHVDDGLLNGAVAAAAQAVSGDGWHWKRRGEVSIAPLCAVTLADWAVVASAAADYDVLASFY